MEPSTGFWDSLGNAVGSSPGWMVVVALTVVGVLFVYARYINPSRERIKMRRIDIDEKQAENDAERIKVNAQLAESQQQNNENTRALTTVMTALQARLESSATRSSEMGGEVSHTRETADHIREMTDETNALVKDMHRHMFREGTD